MATFIGNGKVKLNDGKIVTGDNGGWYDGQQLWNGSFAAPNVINNPNQQGYKQEVSREVVAQTNPANVQFLEQQKGLYANAGSLQSGLNSAQNAFFGNSMSGVQTTGEILADLRENGFLPTEAPPTAPSMLDTYNQLSEQKGIEALQASINDLTAQEDELVAQTRINVNAEKGKPVAQNVMEGRVSVQKNQAQEELDFIQRQKTRKVNELQTALGNIKMIMDFMQTDFQNASTRYNTMFDQAIQTINLVRGIQNDQKTDVQRAMDNARANAQIFVNTIKEGNLDIRNLPPEQQAALNMMEVQAGLPVGFFGALRADPNANIISTSTDNGVTQVLMRNPDGSISVQKYGTQTSGGGGSTAKTGSTESNAALLAKAQQVFSTVKNSYGHVSPAQWNTIKGAFVESGGGGATDAFNKAFNNYANPYANDYDNYKLD